MNQNKPAVVKKLQERFRNISVGRGLYIAFVMPTMLSMFSTRAFAADTIWTKASAIMQDVYIGSMLSPKLRKHPIPMKVTRLGMRNASFLRCRLFPKERTKSNE